MKSIFPLIIFTAAIPVLRGADVPRTDPASPTNPLVLTSEYITLLADALRTNHPAVLAAEARAEAAAQNARAVRTWADPTVRLGALAAREPMRAEDGDLIYGVEQKLPLFGKPAAAREVAKAETEMANANTQYQFQLRRVDFTKHLLQAALTDHLARIAQEDLQWLETLIATLEQRLQAGQASQLELLKAQNEKTRQADRLTTQINHRYHERLAMNIMLGHWDGQPWPEFQLPGVAPIIPHSPELDRLALKFEPKLRLMRQEITRDDANARLTRRQRLPDVSAGIEARNYTGDGSFRQGTLLLGITLPWVNRSSYKAEIARDEARARATRLDVAEYELSVREEIHKLLVMIDAARREAVLLRDQVIPRSQSGMEAIRAAWEAGRGTLADLFEARRMLLDAKSMYFRAVAEQYTAMAQLVLCCGLGDLQAIEPFALPNRNNPAEATSGNPTNAGTTNSGKEPKP